MQEEAELFQMDQAEDLRRARTKVPDVNVKLLQIEVPLQRFLLILTPQSSKKMHVLRNENIQTTCAW